MSPVYLNPQHSSSIPFLDFKGDHHQHSVPMFGYSHDHVSINSNTNYFSCSIPDGRLMSNEFLAARSQEKAGQTILSHDKHYDNIGQLLQNSTQNDGSYAYAYDQLDPKLKTIEKTKKCKPTKLKILQPVKPIKIKGENNHVQRNSNAHFNQPSLRMCSDCHTTTTPLWRSGPQGPKSLCNACGIRQRKAKRAAALAAAAATKYETETSSMSSTTTTITTPTTSTNFKAPKVIVDQNHTLPLKKRCKTFIPDWNNDNNNNTVTSVITTSDCNNTRDKGKKPCLDDFELSSSSNKNYYTSERVFPRDEEEGAILLMSLASGRASSS